MALQVAEAELQQTEARDALLRAKSVSHHAPDDGLQSNALAVVLSGRVQELRMLRREWDGPSGGAAERGGHGLLKSGQSLSETLTASIEHGPSSIICDANSLVMDLEQQPVNAWADKFTEVATLRRYDYAAMKSIKEDHRAFLKKLIHFVSESSPSFERLDEDELLGIVPFIEYKSVSKNSLVVKKVGTVLRVSAPSC